MTYQMAARHLGKRVKLRDPVHRIGGDYVFSAVILRKKADDGYFMQAELTDRCAHSVLIVGLNSIEPVEDEEVEAYGT